MTENRLRLNASKTEMMWIGSAKRLADSVLIPVTISGHTINIADSVRSLGVLIDPMISLSQHINKLVSNCYYYQRQISSIRLSLNRDSRHALVRAMILSRLDYHNGLLGGTPEYLNNRVNTVLRAAARLVLDLPRVYHIRDVMRQDLHWLEFPNRVTFKLSTLAFRCLQGTSPEYLARCCVPSGRPNLRSSTSGLLFIPSFKTVRCGSRAFAVACPSEWNSLPRDLRTAEVSLPVFRKRLKTFLFSI